MAIPKKQQAGKTQDTRQWPEQPGYDGSHYFDALRKQGIACQTGEEKMHCIRHYDWDGWENPYEVDWKSRYETPEQRMGRIAK